MALPLKSGADLYNNQALRLRLHNLGADPTEVGAGLIYFNTSTGLNTSQKARLYTGSAWKTIAFSEDLDVASNADFLALKERVDLLSGDVDTDAIISNMKEVSAFLEGFAEDASLMDYLNTELGKKLDKTGGTITFSGLYGLTLARTSNNTNLIRFTGGDKDFGFLGFAGVGNPIYADYNGVSYALLHSGNVGEYTCKAININSDITDTDKAYVGRALSAWTNWGKATNNPNGVAYTSGLTISFAGNAFQIAKDAYDLGKLYVRMSNYQSDSIPSWSDWKTIAFTDSNVASAQALKHSNGTVGATVDASGNLLLSKYEMIKVTDMSDTARGVMTLNGENILLFGQETAKAGYDTYIYGNTIRLIPSSVGSSTNTAMLINSSGNVTIGGSDLAGTSAKLNVHNILSVSTESATPSAKLSIQQFSSPNAVNGIHLFVESNNSSYTNARPLVLQNGYGNVGIGTDNPTEKLHVVGNLHVTGNIIADGEVSAGGAAEEGGNAGGGGAFHSDIIKEGATQTTIAHGLGTDDIVVSIYEKDGVSGRWSIILTDVEIVDANNIIVSFGSATSVEHKVVIMGAVA